MTAQKSDDLHSGLSVVPGTVRLTGRCSARQRKRTNESARAAKRRFVLARPLHRNRQILHDDQRNRQPIGERTVVCLKRRVRDRQQCAFGHLRHAPVGVGEQNAVPDRKVA